MDSEKLPALLAEIRDRHSRVMCRQGHAAAWIEEARLLAEESVPVLLRALDEALKLAGDAKATSWGSGGGGPFAAVAWNLDPEKLREAVLAELTGKERKSD